MTDRAEHWDQIFTSKPDKELGWYEADVGQTLAFLDRIPREASQTVFLRGAGTSVAGKDYTFVNPDGSPRPYV